MVGVVSLFLTGAALLIDASLVFRQYMGFMQFDSMQLLAADVDGDGVITPNDASLIFRRFMSFIDKFPVED